MRTLHSRFGRGIAAVTGLAIAGVTLAAVPAQAAAGPPPGTTTWNHPYSKGYCFYSGPLKKGLQVTLSGKVRYKRRVIVTARGVWILFKDPTLINPKATLKTYNKCTSGKKPARVSKAKVEQLWYDWKCKTSVSVFVGLPWQAGVGATRSCGSTKRAHRETDYGRGSVFTQNNSGAPVRWGWGGGKRLSKGAKICLHADGAATAWVGNTSDLVSRALDVCVPASYKARP